MSTRSRNTQVIFVGLAAVAAAGVLYYLSRQAPSKAKSLDDDGDMADDDTVKAKGRSVGITSKGPSSSPVKSAPDTMKSDEKATSKMDEKDLHAKIEELDTKGKVFFKNKQVGY